MKAIPGQGPRCFSTLETGDEFVLVSSPVELEKSFSGSRHIKMAPFRPYKYTHVVHWAFCVESSRVVDLDSDQLVVKIESQPAQVQVVLSQELHIW